MNKRFGIMKNFVIKLLLAICMIATSVLFGVKIADINTTPNSPENSSSEKMKSARFVLKYSDGVLSLFEGDSVIETFSEVNFSTLPPIDRESLTDGIEFDYLDDVYRIIEDFDG